jgi:hypothetical protein
MGKLWNITMLLMGKLWKITMLLMGKLWKITPLLMGKSTISKWQFSSSETVGLPEGNPPKSRLKQRR